MMAITITINTNYYYYYITRAIIIIANNAIALEPTRFIWRSSTPQTLSLHIPKTFAGPENTF